MLTEIDFFSKANCTAQCQCSCSGFYDVLGYKNYSTYLSYLKDITPTLATTGMGKRKKESENENWVRVYIKEGKIYYLSLYFPAPRHLVVGGWGVDCAFSDN